MPSIFTHLSLPKCFQCLNMYYSPHCFLQAPALTSVCLPPPGLPLCCSAFSVIPVGLGHCLSSVSIWTSLLKRCYWLNSRALNAVPMGLCPSEFRSTLIFFWRLCCCFSPQRRECSSPSDSKIKGFLRFHLFHTLPSNEF